MKKKVKEMKDAGEADLSQGEDLSLAVANLVSLEEHFFFTSEKTHEDNYIDWLHQVREMRKELLKRLMPQNDGESWCISKHLLGTMYRLMEVGTKFEGAGEREEAKKMFAYAYELYTLFWALRLHIIDSGDLKKKESRAGDGPWSFEDIVEKLVDCCDEGQ
ncbi:MAG: hypothetical protein M1335_02345 [Chloroflexi bacterium]|nr:hypothetical protein [Chloroflexota bacterium]